MSICGGVKKALRERPVTAARKPVPAGPSEKYLDLYIWTVAQNDEFHEHAFGSPLPVHGIGWANKGTNEVFLREDWVQKPYRVEGKWSMRDFLETASSRTQLSYLFHEIYGHALNSWDHGEGHAIMGGGPDHPEWEDIPWGERFTDEDAKKFKDQTVDAYPAIRIHFWYKGLDYVGDDPY